MKKEDNIKDILQELQEENIKTWFDLGLFLDRIKEANEINESGEKTGEEVFRERLIEGGVAFITFHFMVDGVTVEISKYAKYFEKNFPAIPIHYIGGSFKSRSETLINSKYKKCLIPEISGFNEWDLYEEFFMTDLDRGSPEYNALIRRLWESTLIIIEKLGSYLTGNNIKLLYVVNLCSNPGNVAAALALVLLSEYLNIPVINNNHDFYFEGGNSRFDRISKHIKKGPRDFFFKNAHLGEVFSLIEILYPWESKHWLNLNINNAQTEYLIRQKGHNPARVCKIGTAVDTTRYTKNDKRRNINVYLQFEKILARYRKQLISYSVDDVKRGSLVNEKNPKPILIGNKTVGVKNFGKENIIFLQPTRIISRKRIELGFSLLVKMFENQQMKNRFINTPKLKITFLISGPIADGHYRYYEKIIRRFEELLEEIPEIFRSRVYLALLLGEMDKNAFLEKFEKPIEITDLYNISSLILLPSKTEGRGLPIIEAAACGVPIFCRRYEPEEVFLEVIGEHLEEKDRLKVYEFKGKKINKTIVEHIIDRVFYPHKYASETQHNRRIVEDRYSLDALSENLNTILFNLYCQLQPEKTERQEAINALTDYRKLAFESNEDTKDLLKQDKRHYLPGYGRLSFMLMLKSLIDPSYFRIEQQKVRGGLFFFAWEILKNDPELQNIPAEKKIFFYNSVEQIFRYVDGTIDIRHDHSMSYRHRNKNKYPYQEFTFQELTGIINMLYLRNVQPAPKISVDLSPEFFTDWNLALLQLSTSNFLAIDDREILIEKLKKNLPVAYFPGEFIMYELEFFALQAIRSRLDLPIELELTRDHLIRHKNKIAPVYIFAQENKLGKQLNKAEIIEYIKTGLSNELRLLYEYKLLCIITTKQLCVGIHFPQLGHKPLKILNEIRKQGGFIISNRRHAALMTDIVNMDRFHIGKIRSELSSGIMGTPIDSGYIQYVPAGLRTTLAYPTPIQTAKDFYNAFHSEEYKKSIEKIGEEKVREILLRDAEERGSPVMHVLKTILEEEEGKKPVSYEYISGKYEDNNPYNGVLANINLKKEVWNFAAVSTKHKPMTVSEFVEKFEKDTGEKASISWNGGYILNPELIGKLGLAESYIGSPLGLLILNGKCHCPPLYNKAALIIDKEGNANIQRVNCSTGIIVRGADWEHELSESNYNISDPGEEIVYYDLLYKESFIQGRGRVFLRLSGNVIKEIIYSGREENIDVIPVGLTLSFPVDKLPSVKLEQKLEIIVPAYNNMIHAIEAGPLLINNGKPCIDMKIEGWKTHNSIATQAARLDYLDMRGPKIAVGMNDSGELNVLTINGRIRESVGASHTDMASILINHGITKAMGFDPGGSSTLVVNGKTLNISPYNHNYEYGNYSLPPEPRAVSNAVIGYIKG